MGGVISMFSGELKVACVAGVLRARATGVQRGPGSEQGLADGGL